MKNTLKFLSLFIAVLTVFSLTGCSFSVVSADKLIRPPKSGAEIENAIEKATGESILLKSPVNSVSEYNSPLTLIDLDADGTEEAVAFYTTTSNNSSVHLNVLKHINDEWVSIGDFSGYGNNIETLSFRNLSKGMTQYDIVATWSYIDNKVLTIHKVSGTGRRSKLRLVCNESYSAMGYVDIDKDGSYELFLISGDFADKARVPVAKVIRIEKYNILNIGMTSLSRDIVAFENTVCQDINDENISMMSVYDYINNDGMYSTDVVYWDCKRSCLDVMRVDSKTNSAFSTLRKVSVLSADVNGDSLIDIPVQEQIVGSSMNENAVDSALTYTKWCKLVPENDGIGLEQSGKYRIYFTDRDYFEAEDELIQRITAVTNAKNDSWDIMTYNPENLIDNTVLLSVKKVAQDNLDNYISSGYKQLSSMTNDGFAVVYQISEAGKLHGISDGNLINISL
ncbi:MAG: hypothetical protein IJ279_04560 [Clostridia bacterium]|nr:hypothetical protein [Clostridia bacterium]